MALSGGAKRGRPSDRGGFDASCAFLQRQFSEGDQDAHVYGVGNRRAFLKAPQEYSRKGWVLQLKKVVYGYADAPRRWFNVSDEA